MRVYKQSAYDFISDKRWGQLVNLNEDTQVRFIKGNEIYTCDTPELLTFLQEQTNAE